MNKPVSSINGESVNIGFVIFISIVATIGGFLFGYDSGVINGTVDGLQSAFQSESVGTGFNVSSMLLGCAVGAFFAGWLAERLGRRSLLLVAAVFFLISAWGQALPQVVENLFLPYYRWVSRRRGICDGTRIHCRGFTRSLSGHAHVNSTDSHRKWVICVVC